MAEALARLVVQDPSGTDFQVQERLPPVAVVTVNQVTVKPQRDGPARLVPALGESYAHACTTRVILSWENDDRVAFITKSPRLAQARAKYTITAGGVRDVRGVKRAPS